MSTLQKKINKDYVTNREAVKLTGVAGSTLRTWADLGKVQTYKTAAGQRLYNTQCLQTLINCVPITEKKKYTYCRVSSKKQLPDLNRQTKQLNSFYPTHERITDCASGINFKRKGLQTILESAIQGTLSEVVVAHRDRLSRFAFELIKWIIEYKGAKLIVLDEEIHKSTEQELAEDLLSIVHIYTCRQMGKRRYKTKDIKDKIKDILTTEIDFTGMDEHEQVCVQQNSECDQ